MKITNAFLGSCASGRVEDMRIAARILKGRKIHPRVMFNVTPGSSDAMLRADKEGVISTLLEAGCFVCAPSCGMCPGFYTPLVKNEVCITSSTTNYPDVWAMIVLKSIWESRNCCGISNRGQNNRPEKIPLRRRKMALKFKGKVWIFGDNLDVDFEIVPFRKFDAGINQN